MVADVSVRGTETFLALSKALKYAGEKEVRKQLTKSLKAAVKPVIPASRESAKNTLPSRGGYGVLVARAPQRVQVRTGAKTAGVRLVVLSDRSSAQRANRGIIRHPVYGNREVWVDQRLAIPGWFDVPALAALPDIQDAALRAIDDVANEIVRRTKRG